MKQKIGKVLLTLMIMFLMTKNVYGAADVDLLPTYYRTSDSNISNAGEYIIYKSINGAKPTQLVRIIIKDGSNRYLGYCIDVGATLPGQGGVEDLISPLNQSLEDYINSTLNNSAKSKELSKKINEYIYIVDKNIYSGYDMTNVNNKEKGEYYAAAQLLIWEALYKAGYRQNYYSENVTLTLGKDGAGDEIVLTKEKNDILAAIDNYYKTPSFCSSKERLELAVGETATYTDNNGVLANYKVNCSDGIKCETQGNKLTVSIVKNTGKQDITFTKSGAGEETKVYREKDYQGVVINQGKIEPVSCKFGVDTYQNVQTSGMKITLIISIGLIFGLIAYLIYYRSQILQEK